MSLSVKSLAKEAWKKEQIFFRRRIHEEVFRICSFSSRKKRNVFIIRIV